MRQQAILIVAQSGRFLAQIAARAGYHPIWVADCFGDSDTLAIATQWHPISDLNDSAAILTTILALSDGESCHLIYGAGIELFYHILDKLPSHIKLVGNSQKTVEAIKDPSHFFNTLDHLVIPHPSTQLSPPKNTLGWLSKSVRGLGGSHIQCKPISPQGREIYYQRHIIGSSGSILFLANGVESQLLSINQQYTSDDTDRPFLLSGLAAPIDTFTCYQSTILSLLDRLMTRFDLYGLNSLDFIVNDAGELLVLEINPRPSASAELLTTTLNLFDLHLAACFGSLPTDITASVDAVPHYLHYLFATHKLKVPNDIIWPLYCHDTPPAGHIIQKGEPICTAIVDSAETFIQSREQLTKAIHHLLNDA